MDLVELKTDRLTLRCPSIADEAAVAAACTDPEIQRFVPVPSPYTAGDAHEFVVGAARAWDAGTAHAFGFYVASTAELAGMCELTWKSEGVVEVGYWTVPAHGRRGYTAEAARRLCQWGFEVLGIHRIDWWAVVGNEGSKAVAESIGFEVEGLLRQRAMLNGAPQDWWVGGLLARPV